MKAPKKVMLAALSALVILPLTGCALVPEGDDDFRSAASETAWETAWDTVEDAAEGVCDMVGGLVAVGGGIVNDLSGADDSAANAREGISDALMDVPATLRGAFGAEGSADDSLAAKAGSIVVTNARDGSQVAVVSDRARLQAALEGLGDAGGWRLVGSAPDDHQREYEFSYRQNETMKLGQDPASLRYQELLRVTTYRDSCCVAVEVANFAPCLILEAPSAYVETLRELAS